MLSLLVSVGAVAVPVVAIALVINHRRTQGQRMCEAARRDAACVSADVSTMGDATVTLRFGAHVVAVTTSRTGGKHSRDLWEVRLSGCRFGADYTTLNLSREGFFSPWRDKLGLADIQVGDKDFDDSYKIQGADEDKIRALMRLPEVQRAVRLFFAPANLRSEMRLTRDGEMRMTYYRHSGYSYDDAKHHAKELADLAAALDEHRRVQPASVAPQKVDTSGLSAVGGTSGAPVGFGSRR